MFNYFFPICFPFTEESQADAAMAAASAQHHTTEREPIVNTNTTGSSTYVASSPVASRGSASSDPWPSQSDEDIDRLVALHRNRSSLTSLGVSHHTLFVVKSNEIKSTFTSFFFVWKI